MKAKIVQVLELPRKMYALLRECDELDWADASAKQAERPREGDDDEVGEIARELLRLVAGAGSLSDLVLYQNEIAKRTLNDRFDTLRTELSRGLLELVPGRGNGKETKRGDA